MSDYQQDLSDMASTMKGCDSLSGWDCLVAYSEDAINSLLSERASALGILDPLTWSAEYNGMSLSLCGLERGLNTVQGFRVK